MKKLLKENPIVKSNYIQELVSFSSCTMPIIKLIEGEWIDFKCPYCKSDDIGNLYNYDKSDKIKYCNNCKQSFIPK